jgi:hypothetical protein
VLAATGLPLGEAAYGTLYAGALGSLALLLSIGQARRNRQEKVITWLLLLIPVLDLLALTVGPAIEGHLGFLRSFQFVRIRLFVPFALAANVAIAISLLQARVEVLRTRRSAAVIALGAAALFLVQVAVCSRMTLYLVRRLGFPPPDLPARERLLGFALAATYFLASALVAVLVVFLFRRGRTGWLASGRLAGFLTPLILVAFADRAAFARIERYVESWRLISFQEALGETPAISYLRSLPNPEGYRILTLGNHSSPNLRDHPDRLFFHGLPCADGYEVMYPLRYHQLFGILTGPSLERDPRRAAYFRSWGERAYSWGAELHAPVAGLAGIRWMYVRGMPGPGEPWRQVFAKNDERIYENAEVFPRAFVVSAVRRFANRDELLAGLREASADVLRSVAFVEGSTLATDAGGPPAPPEAPVAFRRYSLDRVEIEVDTTRQGVLILTDMWAPGWVSKVNGIPAKVFPVDCAFRGVEVPAGRSWVEFTYRPTYTYVGFVLALVGCVIVGFLYAGGSRWKRTAG